MILCPGKAGSIFFLLNYWLNWLLVDWLIYWLVDSSGADGVSVRFPLPCHGIDWLDSWSIDWLMDRLYSGGEDVSVRFSALVKKVLFVDYWFIDWIDSWLIDWLISVVLMVYRYIWFSALVKQVVFVNCWFIDWLDSWLIDWLMDSYITVAVMVYRYGSLYPGTAGSGCTTSSTRRTSRAGGSGSCPGKTWQQ